MKPKHQRLAFVVVSMVFLCVAALMAMQAFRENLIFFYSPSELPSYVIAPNRLIRVGGLVEKGIRHNKDDAVEFTITDGKANLNISYHGILPGLFREGQGAVAEGYLVDETHFRAERVLTKHDENYMPKEVIDSLRKNGRWYGDKPAP